MISTKFDLTLLIYLVGKVNPEQVKTKHDKLEVLINHIVDLLNELETRGCIDFWDVAEHPDAHKRINTYIDTIPHISHYYVRQMLWMYIDDGFIPFFNELQRYHSPYEVYGQLHTTQFINKEELCNYFLYLRPSQK